MIFALGLIGHLKNLLKFDSFEYLRSKHDMTSIGLLLGLSASYIESHDTTLTQLLSLHIPAMLPDNAAELQVSVSLQSACLVGIGLVHMSSQHQQLTERLIDELDSLDTDKSDMSECYYVSCGFALVFISL